MARTNTLNNGAATVGYEAQRWQMADALCGSMDAAECKRVVLGLIFLKCISDAFKVMQYFIHHLAPTVLAGGCSPTARSRRMILKG